MGNLSLRCQRAREAARLHEGDAVPQEGHVEHKLRVDGETLENCEKFFWWLCRRYGNIHCAWRCSMDPHGGLLGVVSRAEFFETCRRIGYHHKLKDLWDELDYAGNGEDGRISLASLDPEAWEALDSFRSFLAEKYRDLASAWVDGFKAQLSQRLFQQEFRSRCKKLGYKGDPDMLFDYLEPEPGRGFITFDDIDPKCAQAERRGRPVKIIETPKGQHGLLTLDFHGRQEALHALPFGGAIDNPPEEIMPLKRNVKSYVADLRKLMASRFGSTLRGWRRGLDPAGIGYLTKAEFDKGCMSFGYSGSPKQLWAELSLKDREVVRFSHIDPKAFEAARHFRKKLVEKCGSIKAAWSAFLTKDGCDLTEDGCDSIADKDFVARAKELGTKLLQHESFSML